MVRRATKTDRKDTKDAPAASPKCLKIAEKGIKDDRDLSRYLSASIGDIVSGRIANQVANSAFRGVNSLLRVAELRIKHGIADPTQTQRIVLVP